ncbi:MAG: T9SS type A sorting domain-containing protein [Bacteroidota bacterium]
MYDILGREVATLVDGVEEAGYKSVQFDAKGLASGVYLYRLEAGAFVETKKLLLLR